MNNKNNPFAEFMQEAEAEIAAKADDSKVGDEQTKLAEGCSTSVLTVAEPPATPTPTATSTTAAAATAMTATSLCGDLLITGCNDWENMTGAKPNGYDIPHLIRLKSPVSKVYSSSSSFHLFLTLSSGELLSLGKNSNGQLGVGDQSTRLWPTEVKLETASKVIKVATGKCHTLLVTASGELFGCGANNFGQLGLGEGTKLCQDSLCFKKIPSATSVRDVACGADFSLFCTHDGSLYSFGHPEHGQLGHGSNGEYIKESKKGVQYAFVTKPKQVRVFCAKDSRGKPTGDILAMSVKVRAVAAGKNHAMCMEEWDGEPVNRVFTWGFGGYSRCGHSSGDDEYVPRELTFFSRPLPQQRARKICCGATFSCAVTESSHFYFWGKLPNSPRGEAVLYPKLQQELYSWSVNCMAAGSSFIVLSSDDTTVAWGQPVAGKFGFEGDVRSTAVPKFVERLRHLRVIDMSCGYGHIAAVVDSSCSEKAREALEDCPVLKPPKPMLVIDSKRTGSATGGGVIKKQRK